MRKSITKLLCVTLILSIVITDVLAHASTNIRNKPCKSWRKKYIALARVSSFLILHTIQNRDAKCDVAYATAEIAGCAFASAYVSASYENHYTVIYSPFCSAGESFIPPQQIPVDVVGKSEISMTSRASVGGSNFIRISNIDGFLKTAANTGFGATYRIIIWAPQDNETTFTADENITSEKILWEANARIENGQLILEGGFKQGDFSVAFSDEEITLSATNERKLVRIAKAAPSERLRREGLNLDINRDIKQPLRIENPRNVPVEVINNVNADNIAITILSDVGFGTYQDIFVAGAAVAKTGNNVQMKNATDKLNEIVFNNYPQPFSDKTTIEFSVPETQNATVEVFNVDGKRLQVLYDGVANKEENYLIDFKAGNLPNGLYICRFRTDAEVRIRKLLIAR